MSEPRTYRSSGMSFFDACRIALVVLVLGSFVLFFLDVEVGQAILSSLIAAVFIALLSFVLMSCVITVQDRKLTVQTLFKTYHLDDVATIDSWWNYDFGSSTRDVTSQHSMERRSYVNRIYVFAKLTDHKRNSILLREEIHLSEKFPNDHPYRTDIVADPEATIRVWDLNKCLNKLGLTN